MLDFTPNNQYSNVAAEDRSLRKSFQTTLSNALNAVDMQQQGQQQQQAQTSPLTSMENH